MVPDTSVVLKWYLAAGEPDRERALAVRQAFLRGTLRLVVPDLLLSEVANVLRHKPEWTAARVGAAVAALIGLGLEVGTVALPVLERALAIASAHRITVYDAAFAALAEQMDAEFVSADEKLVGNLAELQYVRALRAFPLAEAG